MHLDTDRSLHVARSRLRTPRGFELEHSLSFFCSFAPTRGEQRASEGVLTKAWSIEGRAALVALRADTDGLSARITTERPLSESAAAALCARVRFQLSLDDETRRSRPAPRAAAHRPVVGGLRALPRPGPHGAPGRRERADPRSGQACLRIEDAARAPRDRRELWALVRVLVALPAAHLSDRVGASASGRARQGERVRASGGRALRLACSKRREANARRS